MFHLLVAHGGWDERGGNLSTSRVYIRNDVEHEGDFSLARSINESRIWQLCTKSFT